MLHTEVHTGDQVTHSLLPIRTSTPIPIDAAGTSRASLTALESGLRVVNTPGSQLPELLTTTQATIAVPTTGTLSTDDDFESSVHEVLMLVCNARTSFSFDQMKKNVNYMLFRMFFCERSLLFILDHFFLSTTEIPG